MAKQVYICSRRWADLEPTNHPMVRYCTGCASQVVYAEDDRGAEELLKAGRCVAFGPSRTGGTPYFPDPGPLPVVGWLVMLDGPRCNATLRFGDGETRAGGPRA